MELEYYFKVAYTTIICYINISKNWNCEDFIDLLKNKICQQIPILINKQFEIVEFCQNSDEEGNPLQISETPIQKGFYIRIIGDTECPICYETYFKQKPRILNQICGHECCKHCFTQLHSCHICRGQII